jgi:hypothetical protein
MGDVEEEAEDHEIIETWAIEAEQRDEEMSRSEDPGFPASDVFERLRSSLPSAGRS